eukprot:PITA_13823
MGTKGTLTPPVDSKLHESNSSVDESLSNDRKRIELFHIRIVVNHTKVEIVFDSVSQANLITESLAKKIVLETKPHPKPYPLGWIHDKEKLNVTQQWKVKFVIVSKLVDEVEMDVIPLDIYGMLLGSPYLYDRKAVFFRHENKYHITKGGVEYTVQTHQNKINSSLVSGGKMKILVNSSKTCMLMVVREKECEFADAFQGCDGKHKQELMELISDYNKLFQELKGLTPKREIQHEIYLLHDTPLPNIDMYRMSMIEMEEIKRQVQELLGQGVIGPSSTPCSSPIVLVPKKDGSWRMCVDYRVLNKISIKNHYPLSRIDDLLEQLKSVVYFKKLDLRSGYHQVMNDIFQLFIDEFVLVYLDDILVFSKSWFEHVSHVNKVLDVLKKEKIFVKLSKCEFGKTSLGYLGHIVGHAPLHTLTSVKHVFYWGGRQHKSFETLKEKISTAPILALSDLQQPFEIETDANGYAMGAVLMQQKKLICFHSEKFSQAVINYPTYDKELYALVQSVKKWKHYLIDKETIIHTDHQPLQ